MRGATKVQLALAVLKGRREEARLMQERIIRRTEIPKGAKNPTRDATVIVGEMVAREVAGRRIEELDTEIKQIEGRIPNADNQ